ncbi:helix-turn-helix transcriptional regulator [Xanthobacteraceae bacterium Astr-EGSB]|uniref:helix-turn-helix domain-containing protein n=1 Tax=Astrobacterium formosum TaxID=3069710 RepID=UPI0027B16A0A|nr:helix-turn-helix transcriptional regulator [Xanthobacteraceae bacterium Astr-EGSB]
MREKTAEAARAGIVNRHRGLIEVPTHTNPVVRGVFEAMNRRLRTQNEVSAASGVHVSVISSWKYRHMPRLDLIEAALNTLDFELAIVPRGHRGPDGFLRDADPEEPEPRS